MRSKSSTDIISNAQRNMRRLMAGSDHGYGDMPADPRKQAAYFRARRVQLDAAPKTDPRPLLPLTDEQLRSL